MLRDYGQEIDQLREELREIKRLLEQGREAAPTPVEGIPPFSGEIAKMSQSVHRTTEDPHLLAVLGRLEDQAGSRGNTGAVAYTGVFASGGNQSTWVREWINTDDLLELWREERAELMMRCVGSREKSSLLLSLLRAPQTVSQLVESCGFGSTGQAYHHLNPLIQANLVEEEKPPVARGRYRIVPHRVQGLLMLLCGIYDLTDHRQ